MAGTNIIEIRVAGTGTNLNPSANSGSSSTGSLAGLGGKLGVIAGAAMLVVNLLGDMLSVFKPVMTILKTIAKLLGEFLRPIAEFAIALLQPFLSFLKPMVMIFRAMMLPVMNLVRQYSAVMTSQVASGDYAGATKTGVDIIGLTLGGFFISLANVLGTMLINIIGNLLQTLTNGLIDSVVLIMHPVISLFDKIFKTDLADALLVSAENLKNNVASAFQNGMAYATSALQLGTEIMMDGLIGFYTTKLETLKSNTEILMPGVVKPFEDTLTNTTASVSGTMTTLDTSVSGTMTTLDTSVSGTMTTLDTNVKTATTNMTNNVNNAFSEVGIFSIPSKFGKGLSTMQIATSNFTDSMETYAQRIKSALSSAQREDKEVRKIRILGVTVATISD